MRPSAAGPTGTLMKLPVSTISMPRTTPSVGSMDTARTWLRPMCCCTSSVTCSAGRPSAAGWLMTRAL
jgi:hypothetical protein